MTELNVIHVVRQFAPGVGGLEEAVLKLALALRERGVGGSIVTLDRIAQEPAAVLPRTERISGLPVTRIPFHGSWRYPVAPSVLHHLASADVVHVHAIDFFFDFLAATRVWHRKPLIASTHGGFFHTRFAHRLKQVYFQTATRVSALGYHRICASSRNDQALFTRIAPSNTVLVENGVDTGKWEGLAPPTPPRRLIAIGRFASHKHLDKLFPLLRALRGLHADWRLVIAGSPWDVSPDRLRQAAAAAAVGGAVQVVVRPGDDAVGAMIREAGYVVSASSHEGFGLSVVEGMAAGLVPILNDIPPFRDLVARSGCGRLIDIDDPGGAAAVVEQLHGMALGRPLEGRLMAMRSARRFSWAAAAELFRDHYGAAAARPDFSPRLHEAGP